MHQNSLPEIKDQYLTARKTIDQKADHIWCITTILSAIGSDEVESITLDAHTLKYWMKSISLTVGEIIEILDQLHERMCNDS